MWAILLPTETDGKDGTFFQSPPVNLNVHNSIKLAGINGNIHSDPLGLVGKIGDMSATSRVSRHILQISGWHPECRDILGRISVFKCYPDVSFVSDCA